MASTRPSARYSTHQRTNSAPGTDLPRRTTRRGHRPRASLPAHLVPVLNSSPLLMQGVFVGLLLVVQPAGPVQAGWTTAAAVRHVVVFVRENDTTDHYFRSMRAWGANVATDWPTEPSPPGPDQPHTRAGAGHRPNRPRSGRSPARRRHAFLPTRRRRSGCPPSAHAAAGSSGRRVLLRAGEHPRRGGAGPALRRRRRGGGRPADRRRHRGRPPRPRAAPHRR